MAKCGVGVDQPAWDNWVNVGDRFEDVTGFVVPTRKISGMAAGLLKRIKRADGKFVGRKFPDGVMKDDEVGLIHGSSFKRGEVIVHGTPPPAGEGM